MKKIYRYGFIACSLLVMLAASCISSDMAGPVAEGERIGTEISFAVEKLQAVTQTRAEGGAFPTESGMSVTMSSPAETRAEGESEEILDLWILQFGSDGNLLTPPILLTGSDLAKETHAGYTRYTIEAELIKSSLSTICMLANLDDASAFAPDVTLAQFRGMTKSLADRDAAEGYANRMAGFYEGPVPMPGQPFVWMKRLVAKISLTVSYPSGQMNGGFLNLTSTQVKSVPASLSYYDGAANTDWLFPAAGTGNEANFMDYPATYGDPRGAAQVWYVPENIRGINETVATQRFKWRIYDPSWNGGADGTGGTSYATHIELKGIFTMAAGTRSGDAQRSPVTPADNPAWRTTITLYPGANITTDYNVSRNRHYTMSADIANFLYQDNENRDYRIEVDYGPLIIYNYYYESDPDTDTYEYIGTEYVWEGVTVGEQFSATAQILNAMKGLIPVTGDFDDGRADPDPVTVAERNGQNVVNIYYDKQAAQTGFYVRYHSNPPVVGESDTMEQRGPYQAGAEHTVEPYFALFGFISFNNWICLDYWNTEPDGSGTDYSPGDLIHIDSDTNLYLMWRQSN